MVLWLQGGPGGSSLFGLFVENGPFIIDANNDITFRTTSWSLTHSGITHNIQLFIIVLTITVFIIDMVLSVIHR